MFISVSQADTILMRWMPWIEMNSDISKSGLRLPITERKTAWRRSNSPSLSASAPDIYPKSRLPTLFSRSPWRHCSQSRTSFISRPANFWMRIDLLQHRNTDKRCSAPFCHMARTGRFALSHYLTLGRACNICTEMQRLHKIVLFSENLPRICRRWLQRAANTDGREIWALHPEKDLSKSSEKTNIPGIFPSFIVIILSEFSFPVYHNIVLSCKKALEINEIFHKILR